MGDLELMRPAIIDMLGVFFLKVINLKYFLTFVCYRVKHLNRSGDPGENIDKYVQYMKEVDKDWKKIGQKIEAELVREKAKV